MHPRVTGEGGHLAKDDRSKEEEEALEKRGRKGKKIRIEVTEEVLGQEDMFMSVRDFEQQRVVLPDFLQNDDWEEEEGEEGEDGGSDEDGEEGDDEGSGEGEGEDDGDQLYEDDEEDTEGGDEEGGEQFCGRDCYKFNLRLEKDKDDRCCIHCKMYLTLQCPHLSDFMDDIDGLDPDD